MNDQQKIDPGAQASAIGVEHEDLRDWVENNLRRETTAANFSKALVACDPSDRLDFLEYAHEFFRAGWPTQIFGSVMDQAVFWADRASRSELKAHALVCFERMRPQDQTSFLEYVQRKKGE